MLVEQAIEKLNTLSKEKSIVCQVVDEQGRAWNMYFEILDVPNSSFIQLKVFHPDLKELPSIEFGGGEQYPPSAD